MKYIVFVVTLLASTMAVASNYICIPEVTVGWENNKDPNDIKIIEPQNKWLLQPIEPRQIAVAYRDELKEVNYSLTKLGNSREYGYCNLSQYWGFCLEFNWPEQEGNPERDNKLNDYNEFTMGRKSEDNDFFYVFSDIGNQMYYGLEGVSKYSEPKLAIERGKCEEF